MGEPLIPGGYILLSRKIIESEIWDKPPLYLKVWIYILAQAQHKKYKGLKRGQLWVTIPEIQEACSWHVGFRRVTPTKDQIFNILEWMRNPSNTDESRFAYESNDESNARATMITTMRATRGLLINVDNYSVYQSPKNYESNDESNNEKATRATREQREGDTTNKNDKNDKNYKNDDSDFGLQDFISRFTNLTGKKEFVSSSLTNQFNSVQSENGIDVFDSILDELNKSTWLQSKPLAWILNNVDKIVAGNYRDFETKTTEKKNNFNNFEGQSSSYSAEELDRIAREQTKRRNEQI